MVSDPDEVVVLDPSRLGIGPAHPGHEVVAAVLEHAVFPDVVDRAAFVVAHDVERLAGVHIIERKAGPLAPQLAGVDLLAITVRQFEGR